MMSKVPSDELKEQVGDIPISTHTQVLGADITVPQLHQRCEMYGEKYPLSGRGQVKIAAVGRDGRISAADRRYIAAWVRRNLFNGHGGDR